MADESSLRELLQGIRERYPELGFARDEQGSMLRGSFPVLYGSRVLSRFLIEMRFPEGVENLPAIKEIGGRIPRREGLRHTNPDGTICAGVPEVWLLKGKSSLLDYLDGPVQSYFLGQLFVERGLQWPHGEWDHGCDGYYQAYGEMLEVTVPETIKGYLEQIAKPEGPDENALCPCLSGQVVRDCHLEKINQLRSKIPISIAASALSRLRWC